MLDFSFTDPRLLFPKITEWGALALERISFVWTIITLILLVVGEWMLYKKFGEKSWKSLIPYYNTYILYKHTWSRKVCWGYLTSSVLFNIVQSAATYSAEHNPESSLNTILLLIALPFGIIAAVCSILFAFRMAEAFGKGKLFSIGLLLVYPVFVAILGLGKAQYIGPCGEKQTSVDVQ